MSGTTSDADVVRGVLQALAAGAPVTQEDAQAALAAFKRLVELVPGAVLAAHAWCACGHEHGVLTATGLPSPACVWVFCRCPGFRQRSQAPPSPAEVETLRAKLRQEWAAYDAGRCRPKK